MSKQLENISSLNLDEQGVCSTDQENLVAFGALPHETIDVAPITRKAKKLFARTIAVHKASSDRVAPPCSVANYCGGCQFQHMAMSAQLTFKQHQVEQEFAGCEPTTWFDPISAGSVNYRTKARLGVKFVDKKQKLLVGFRETMKPYIAETTSCPVLKAPADDLIQPLAQLIASLSVVRALPQVELAMGDTGIALIFRHLEPLTEEDHVRLIEFAVERNVQIYLQPGNAESVHKLYPSDAVERLYYQLPELDLEFAFHPLDFTQVNLAANQQMVSKALAIMSLNERDKVLDAFCGIGNFSLALARHAGEVVGLEVSEGSVSRARENQHRNHLSNASFEVADLFKDDSQVIDLKAYSKVFLDPPRTGAEALCKILASSNVERVGYVSCNPKTLSRDARMLVAGGFELQQLGIINMFPHTAHIESMALFTRR